MAWLESQLEVFELIVDGKRTGVVVADGRPTDEIGGLTAVAGLLENAKRERWEERTWKFERRKRRVRIIGG